MKRILHYLLLAVVLVGLPLGCAWLGGKSEMLADAAGTLHPTAAALANGAARRSQLTVSYSDGTVVAVNGSKTEPLGVTIGGARHVLPPNGWVALSGDGQAGSMNVSEDGVSVQRAWSEEYAFVCRAGRIEKLVLKP